MSGRMQLFFYTVAEDVQITRRYSRSCTQQSFFIFHHMCRTALMSPTDEQCAATLSSPASWLQYRIWINLLSSALFAVHSFSLVFIFRHSHFQAWNIWYHSIDGIIVRVCLCDRMNGAVIKGHEGDVGSRTSVYVHTAHSITRTLSLLQNYGYTSVPTDEVLEPYVWGCHTVGRMLICYDLFWQGIKYVMIPEGIRDFRWLEGLLTGGRVSAGVDHNIQWILTLHLQAHVHRGSDV